MKKWQFITIVFVFLIAGLLNVYFAAQTTQGWTSSFSSFEVDGLRFNYHLSAYMVHPLNATSLIISPSLFPERNASSTFQTSTGRRTTVYAIIHVDTGEIRAKPDTLYFVQDGKIEIGAPLKIHFRRHFQFDGLCIYSVLPLSDCRF